MQTSVQRRSAAIRIGRRLIWGVTFVVLILVAVLFFFKVILPRALTEVLIGQIKSNCDLCQIRVGSTRMDLFPLRLEWANSTFVWGQPGDLVIKADAGRAVVRPMIWQIYRGTIRLEEVFVDSPHVTIEEGREDTPEPPKSQKREGSRLPKINLEIGPVILNDGSFTYAYEKFGRRGPISMYRVQGRVDTFGTLPPTRNQEITAVADGVLENSGKFTLKLTSQLFDSKPNVKVDVFIKDQNLKEVNPFFDNYLRVKLSGKLITGRGYAIVKGKDSFTTVQATYKDFGIEVKKSEERSKGDANLANIFTKIKFAGKNTDLEKGQRINTVHIQREKKQSFVSFVLNGFLQAAFAVATKRTN